MIHSDSDEQDIKSESFIRSQNHMLSSSSSDCFIENDKHSSRSVKNKQLSSASESEQEKNVNNTKASFTANRLDLDSIDSDDSYDQNLTQQDVFGSDTEDENKHKLIKNNSKTKLIKVNYESDTEVTSFQTKFQERLSGNEQENDEIGDSGAIEVDFPVIKAELGEDMHLVKLPNFLSIESRPFDQMYYEDEMDESEFQDEEGRTRLKLKVENTIRWRIAKDAEGQTILGANDQPIRESNARMVRWSDGSLSLHLGHEIFDVHTMDISSDHNHLFVREGSGLQAQSVFSSKLAFRPHSTDSFTHRKLTLSLADKTNKAAKVKLLPFAGENPDVRQQELIKREEERMKASLRRENQRRRMKERASYRELTSAFLEQQKDDDLNPHAISISEIKKRGRHGSRTSKAKKRRTIDMSSTDDDVDDEPMSDFSDIPPKTKTRKARIVSEDESLSE